MECSEVTERLSEYVDGILDQEAHTRVDEHLAVCPGCREALASLKDLVEDLGALPSVKAPDDFLKNIHERLETNRLVESVSDNSFHRIIRKLFVPWRIKIPLELASAALVVVLVIAISKVQQPPEQDRQVPLTASQVVRAKRPEAAPMGSPPVNEVLQSAPPYKAVAIRKAERKRAPLELALVLRPNTAGPISAPSLDPIEQTPPSVHIGGKTRAGMDTAPMEKMHVGTLHEEAPEGLPLEERARLKKESGSLPSPADRTLSEIISLIGRIGGSVMSTEYDEQTGHPLSLLVEIPAKHYNSLVVKLKNLGDLQPPPTVTPETDQQVISIRIRFHSSDQF